MIPLLHARPTIRIGEGPDPPPPVTGGLADIIATMSPSWRDDFSSATGFGDRWSIFGETDGSTALGPVIAQGDHWGTHMHDPALVSIADGALKLQWEKRSGVWYTGGVMTAAAYGYSVSNPAPKAITPNKSVIVARIRLPVTQGNIWGGFWQLARNNQADSWAVRPREIDILEFTYPSPPDGNKDIAYSAVHYKPASGNHASIGVNSAALNNSIYDGEWHEYACHRRMVNGLVKMDFYLDGVFYGSITPPESNNDFADEFFTMLNCQVGFWGTGLPADDVSGKSIEVDWVANYTTPTLPPSVKPTDAPVLQAKGLSLIWQDRLGESDEPVDAYGLWGPFTGSRVAWTDFGVSDRRLDIVTYDNKRCIREVFRAGQPIYLNSVHGYSATRYREMGLCVDVMYPPGFDATSMDPANRNNSGKTMFGLQMGSPYLFKPGFPTKFGWKGAVCFPPDQWGGELGVNWAFLSASKQMQLEWYAHIVGVAEGGVNYDRSWWNSFSSNPRDGAYSHPPKQYTSWAPRFNTPMGRWFRLELYGRMDTNRQDGLLEIWVDGVLRASWPRLDLGGWRGNRNMGRGTHAPAPPAGNNGDSWSDYDDYCFGSGPLSNDCDPQYRDLGGWGFTWPFVRAMGGGYSLAAKHIATETCYQYAHNFRVYARGGF